MCNNCGGSQRTSSCGCSGGSRNSLPIISVNELPQIGRSGSNSFYRLPDNTIWYVNKECNGYVKLNYDKDTLLKLNEKLTDALHRLNCIEGRIGDPYDDSHLVRLIQELSCRLDKQENSSINESLHVTALDSAIKRLEGKFDKLKSVDADAIKLIVDELKLGIEQNSNNISAIRDDIVSVVERVAELKAQEDKDTIYDDTEIKERIQLNTTAINDLKEGQEKAGQASTELTGRVEALEAKEDKDTIYDDSAIQGRVDGLATDVTELKTTSTLTRTELQGFVGRLAVVEAKEDKDTVYDDSELKESIQDLKDTTNDELARLNQLQVDTATQVEEARDDIGSLRERVAILEQKTDNDTLYDDTAIKAEIEAIKAILGEVDDDTQFDPTELVNRISALENADTASSASVTALEARVAQLEVKPDQDTIYNDTEVRELISVLREDVTIERDNLVEADKQLAERLTTLEGKNDVFVSEVEVKKVGSTITLLYTRTDGTFSEVQFDDSDTVAIAYNDEELRRRVEALEAKPDADTVYDDTEVRRFLNRQRANIESLGNRVDTLESKEDKDTTYTAGTGLVLTDTTFAVDTAVVASRADLGRLEGQVGNVVGNVDTLNDEVDNHAVEIADLKRQLAELKDTITNVTNSNLKIYETTTNGQGSLIVTHGLNRLHPVVNLWDISVPNPHAIEADVFVLDANTISVTLPAEYAGPIKVVVIG